MMTNRIARIAALLPLAASVALSAVPALGQEAAIAERVALLKANLAKDKATLRQYEWIQTTVVTVDGKARPAKQERCTYGADGKLKKVLLTPPPARPKKKKEAELETYIAKAEALVREYVPIDYDKIQMAKDAGRASLQVKDPGKLARVSFIGYLKQADELGIDVDLTINRPISGDVATYLQDEKDLIALTIQFDYLDGPTSYPSEANLNSDQKKLRINVKNSGYKKIGK